MRDVVVEKVLEGLQVAQDAVDDEFCRRLNLLRKAKDEVQRQEIFEGVLQVDEVTFELTIGLAVYIRMNGLGELAKRLGAHLLTHPERLTNQQLRLIIHNLVPVRQQAADILRQRPNLTQDDKVYLDPIAWEDIDKDTQAIRARKKK